MNQYFFHLIPDYGNVIGQATIDQTARDQAAIEALLATCVPPDRRSLATRLFARLQNLFSPHTGD